MADSKDGAAAAVADKPVKPDEAVFKQQAEEAEKGHKEVMARLNAVKAKIDLAQPNKSKDGTPSPTQQRRQELLAQLSEIREKQGGAKSLRTSKLEQVKRLDEQLKSRQKEQSAARDKMEFKTVQDYDRRIGELESQVNGGMMKLLEEKQALSKVSNLKKARKNFAQIDEQQKEIDELKAKIKAMRDGMDNPESRAMSEQYNKIQAELDGIKAEQDGAYKNLSGLRDERTKLQAEQREKFDALRKIKDDYYNQKKAFSNFTWEAKQKARERQQAERERYEKEKKMERAKRMLDEAADPAYMDEIRRANSLLHFFDPSHQVEKSPLVSSSGLGAQATRKVNDSGLKGVKLVRKEDRDEDYFAATKKGKKGRKGGAGAEPSAKGFNCPPAVIEDCASMGIDPPASAAEVPAAVEKIKAKLDHWKSEQKTQTQRNVDKAKKEIERLDAEESGEASSGAVNGKKGDDKGVSEVTATLKDASLEDKKSEEFKA